MPLEALLKELDHRQQLSRPGKEILSVCVRGGEASLGQDQMAGMLGPRVKSKGNPFYTWTSAAVHET